MKEIKSKKNYSYLLLNLVVWSIYVLLSLSIFSFNIISLVNNDNYSSKNFFLVILSIFAIFIGIVFFKQFTKNIFIIEIDLEKIKLGKNETYYLSDIVDIKLTGKFYFDFIVSYNREGTAITFKDGTVKYFFDDFYENTWKMKQFLEQVVIQKKDSVIINSIENKKVKINDDEIDTFKGYTLLCFEGFMFWVFEFFFIAIMISALNRKDYFPTIFSVCFITFWFIIFSNLLNYFYLTNEYLIVKNHNYFWKKDIYLLKNIKEVIIESHGRQSLGLTIITNDFKSKKNVAASLYNSTWLELKNKLEQQGVKVRSVVL
ncbi:MAG: hypothetical protein ACEQSR_13585 [Candidatus Methylacidiphilales bacterium]